MSQELTQNLVKVLRQVMATRDYEKISAAFDIFLEADAQTIHEIAEQFLAETDLSVLTAGLFSGEDRRYRLMMDTFYASMLDPLCQRCPTLENAVEHDIENWIEGNTPELARFNAEFLRLAMRGGGTLEDIDPRLSLEHLEARQRVMLEATWASIVELIDARLRVLES